MGFILNDITKNIKRDGALFRGRYKALLIQADEYLTQVIKYVHQNPLKAKIVNNLKTYKWSSHPLYLKGKTINEFIDIDNMLAYFSSRKKEAIKEYKEFMATDIDDEVLRFYSKKNQGSILGGNNFVEMIKRKFINDDKKSNLEIKEKG